MSILGLAKKAASSSAGFVWKASGASSVPILEGGRKMLGGVGSKFKSEEGVGKDNTKTALQIEPAKTGSADPAMAEKMAKLRARKAEIAAQGGKPSTVDSNKEAHERALEGAKFTRVTAMPGGAEIPESMVTDIRRIKELNEELLAQIGNGFGGLAGGLAGLLGNGLKGIVARLAAKLGLGGLVAALGGKFGGLLDKVKGFGAGLKDTLKGGAKGILSKGAGLALGAGKSLISKVPGIGAIAAAGGSLIGKVPGIVAAGKGLASNVLSKGAALAESGKATVADLLTKGKGVATTALEAGKGMLSKGADAAKAAGSTVAAKGSSILEAGKGLIGKVPGVAKGIGGAVLGAGGGLLAAAKSKGASLLESGKGLISKIPGLGGGAAAGAAAGAAGGAAAGKIGLKNIIKNAPVLGLLARTGFAVKRAMDGDWTGAGMEVAAGIASTFPGAGTAGALGIDAALIAKDAGVFGGGDEQKKVEDGAQNIAAAADKANNAGAKISATGKPEIQRAILGSGDDPVSGGLANLQAFVAAAMDEEKGVFVRPARSPFDDNSLFKREEAQPSSFQPSPSGERAFERAPGAAIPHTGGPSRAVKRDAATTEKIAAQRDNNARAGIAQRDNIGRAGNAPSAFTQVPTDSFAASPLGNLISRGEGDYNSYNAGTKGTGGKVKHSGKKDLSSMTLDEIIKSSEERDGNDKDRVFAAGRYQIITPTLKASMKKMGLKGDEKFTPELQDRIFKETLVPQSVNDYLSGKSTDKEKAQIDLAKVWRSFADPRTGKTYADSGAGANHASISAAESGKALDDTRAILAKESVKGTESKTSVALEQASTQAKEAERKKAAPVVVQAQAAPAPKAPANAGGAKSEAQGHMATRNDDSSIKRLTDAKMSYGMV